MREINIETSEYFSFMLSNNVVLFDKTHLHRNSLRVNLNVFFFFIKSNKCLCSSSQISRVISHIMSLFLLLICNWSFKEAQYYLEKFAKTSYLSCLLSYFTFSVFILLIMALFVSLKFYPVFAVIRCRRIIVEPLIGLFYTAFM